MKKIVFSLTLLACAACPVQELSAGQPPRIGVAAAIRGRAEAAASAARPAAKALSGGDPVYLGDRIVTGEKAQVQLMLLDETVFTVGPNSAVTLDKFVYDPGTGAGEISADVVKGYFRFITGKVAKKKPANVKVKVAAGTIGVFGTIVSGQVKDGESVVVLEGPGALNNSGERAGLITVEGAGGGAVTLGRPGYAVTVGPRGVSDAYKAGDGLIASLGAALLPVARGKAGGKNGDEETAEPGASYEAAERESGQAWAAGSEELAAAETAAGLAAELSALGSDISQNLSGFSNPGWDDVRKIEGSAVLATGAGAGVFTPGDVCAGGVLNCLGTWDYSLNINFDTRSILASASIATININDTRTNIPVNYNTTTGAATFSVPTGDGGGSYTWNFSNMGWNNHDITVDGACSYNNGVDSGSCAPEYVSR